MGRRAAAAAAVGIIKAIFLPTEPTILNAMVCGGATSGTKCITTRTVPQSL